MEYSSKFTLTDLVNGDYPRPLNHEEMTKLALQYRKGDEQAWEKMILHNLRLVRSIVYRYSGYWEFEDRFQDGVEGLITAAERYNPSKGKFSHYATWWIRQSITRGVRDLHNGGLISNHFRELHLALLNKRESYFRIHGEYPSAKQLAELYNGNSDSKKNRLTEAKVEEILKLSHTFRCLSLDEPISDVNNGSGHSQLIEFIRNEEVASPDEAASVNEVRQDIKNILEALNKRIAKSFYLKYLDGGERTDEEVALIEGVSRETISSRIRTARKVLLDSFDFAAHYS